jgi:hypothetical protein
MPAAALVLLLSPPHFFLSLGLSRVSLWIPPIMMVVVLGYKISKALTIQIFLGPYNSGRAMLPFKFW